MEIIKLLKNKLSEGKKKDNQNERSMNKRDSYDFDSFSFPCLVSASEVFSTFSIFSGIVSSLLDIGIL